MAEFLQYVLNEMKQHRLAKAEALDLLRQFHGNVLEELNGELSAARSYSDNAVAGHQVQRLSPEAEPAVSPWHPRSRAALRFALYPKPCCRALQMKAIPAL